MASLKVDSDYDTLDTLHGSRLYSFAFSCTFSSPDFARILVIICKARAIVALISSFGASSYFHMRG